MADVRESKRDIAGIRCHLRETGPTQADEAVVFVHGNPGSGEDWVGLLPKVGDFARAVATDMPGYGASARPADFDYTVDGYGRHLAAVLEDLGIRRAHLVLHDFGGPWGLTWAAAHPDAVASVTLLNIGVMPGYRWHKYARVWRTPLVGELFWKLGTRGMFRAMLNADNPKPFPNAFVDRMYDDADAGLQRAVLKLYRATGDVGGLSERLGATLKPLHLKALVLWGEGDAYLPLRYAEIQKQYFDATVHHLPGCGHWPMIDDPETVASLVIPFLRERLVGA